MEKTVIVRGAPQEYICQKGAWQTLETHLKQRKMQRILLLHGQISYQIAQTYLPELMNIYIHFEYYQQKCTDQRIDELVAVMHAEKLDGVVAVGGGKLTDLGKACAQRVDCPIFILPTLAATCAAYTPLSVIYREDGAMDRYEIYDKSNTLILIEPDVLLHAPQELLIAGIGDTLAKWYEARAMITQLPQHSVAIQVAAFAAKRSQEILLSDSLNALEALREKKSNQAFLNIIEAIILLGGMVGGFGDEYGRTSGAHSIHDALTILPQSHRQLHGNKVAYGILVQLAIENNWQEITQLLPFYHQLQLPTSLKDMNLILTEEMYKQVARRATAPEETIHFMKEEITPEIVEKAMKELESYTQAQG